MTRAGAFTILTKYLHNKNLLKHSLAAETGMKGIYRYITPQQEQSSKDEEAWGIAGLLHDIDYEIAQETSQLDKHGLLIFEDGREPNSIPKNIAHAIKSHNFGDTKVMPENMMDWAIYCVDQLTGLIVAGALVHPDKKLSSLTTDYILKRFGEKSFARGAKRESIQQCEEKLGIQLKEFISIVLKSMQEIHVELEL